MITVRPTLRLDREYMAKGRSDNAEGTTLLAGTDFYIGTTSGPDF